MTPDAVIYRYLEIVSHADCDVEKLCLLLSADADLLTRWLKLLDVQVDVDSLRDRIEHLDEQEFSGLAQAQAWSVLPIVGSARLSTEQWLAVLRAACLAEILADYLGRERGEFIAGPVQNVRLRTLLAISGVQLAQDARLTQLTEFRGIATELLEDATSELRIFAVVDAMEIGGEVGLAEKLLAIKPDTFATLAKAAESAAIDLVSELDIDTRADVDWAHRIWLRQQISIVASSFRACRSWHDFLALHQLVSRSLFAQPPLMLIQEHKDGPLSRVANPELVVRVESNTSLIAAAARSGLATQVAESTELAVIDRLFLRELNAEESLAVPVPDQTLAVVMLVAVDENIDVEVAAELYAQAIAPHVEHFNADIDAGTDEEDSILEQFRASEYKRLREIVHEANNPLSIVHNYLHILELRLQHEPEAVEQLELVATELRRAGSVFTRARDIPSQIQIEVPSPGEVSEIDVGVWMAGLAELHTGFASEQQIALHTNLPSESVLLSTEPDKIAQIIGNLVKNAIEDCSAGDEVLLAVRGGVYREGRVGVEFSVTDTGRGLSEEVLRTLTVAKQSAKGGDHQGVGMQIAFKLAAELDGALDVRTEAGQGTTFSLFLPLATILSAS